MRRIIVLLALLFFFGCGEGRMSPQGGTITSVQPAVNGGLTGGGTGGAVSLGLLTSCGSGQILKWGGTSWACSADAGGFDTAGAGLTSTGSTIDVGAGTGIQVNANDIALNMAGATCSSGSFISALGATGTGTCTTIAAGGGVTGTGTANTIVKWTGTSTQGNSSWTDNGTTSTTTTKLLVNNGGATDYNLLVNIGAAITASVAFNGTTDASYFMTGANQDTYIRGGKAVSFVKIGDATNTGGVFIGAAGNATTVSGTLQVGGAVSAVRFLSVDSSGNITTRFDDNSLNRTLALTDRAITAAGNGTGISFGLAAGGAAAVTGGSIDVISENTTFTGATADGSISIKTSTDGSLVERLKCDSTGLCNFPGSVTENGAAVLSGAITANTIPKGSGGNLADSSITDTGGAVTIVGASGANAFTSGNANTGQTATTYAVRGTQTGSYNTTGSAITSFGTEGVATSTRSAGANALSNIGLYGYASGAQNNYALYTDGGIVALATDASATTVGGTLSVNGNTTLGDATTDTVYAPGYMGLGMAADSTKALAIDGSARTWSIYSAGGTNQFVGANQDIIKVTDATAGQTISNSAIYAPLTGSYNTTGGQLTSAGITVDISTTRSAGANNLNNRAAYFNAVNGQTNTALITDNGEVDLGVSSGNVCVGSTGCSNKLNVTGSALVTVNAQVNGSTTLGDTPASDTTTINGTTTANAVVGTTFIGAAGQGNLKLYDTTSAAQGAGGQITLFGNYTGTTPVVAGAIKAMKSNGKTGDYDFDMAIGTIRNGAGDITKRLVIDATGATNALGQMVGVFGSHVGYTADFADMFYAGFIRKNLSKYSRVVGNDAATDGVWRHANGGSTLAYTTSSQSAPPGYTDSVGQITCTSGGTACTAGGSDYRLIETVASTTIEDVRGLTFTLSVWVKAASGTNTSFTLQLARYNDGDLGNTTCAVNSTTWTRCSYTRTFSATSLTDNSEVRAYLMPMNTTAHYIYGAQLEVSADPTPWEETSDVLGSGAYAYRRSGISAYSTGSGTALDNAFGIWSYSIAAGVNLGGSFGPQSAPFNVGVYGDLSAPTGSFSISLGASAAVDADVFTAQNAVVAGTVNASAVARVSNTGTYNTTSAVLTEYAGYFSNTATRSAGANNLTNYGIYATASGAQVNVAGLFDGDVKVNGNTTLGDASGDVVTVAGQYTNFTYSDAFLRSTAASGNVNIESNGGTVKINTNASTGNIQLGYSATTTTVPGTFAVNGSTTLGDTPASDTTTINGKTTASYPATNGNFATANAGLYVTDTVTTAQGVGGGITFLGAYTGTTTTAGALIKAAKTNATSGQFGFDMAFGTRLDGSSDTAEHMRIKDTGAVQIGDTGSATVENNLDILTIGQTGAGQTANDKALIQGSDSGTRDTTAGGITAWGTRIALSGSRSAGSNTYVQVGHGAIVSGGQANNYGYYAQVTGATSSANYGAWVDVSGSSGANYSFYGANSAATMFNNGPLAISGNTTLGDANTDTTTVNGVLTVKSGTSSGLATALTGTTMVIDQANGTASYLQFRSNTAAGIAWAGAGTGGDGKIIYDSSVNAMAFATGTTGRLQIDSNGAVHIGNTSVTAITGALATEIGGHVVYAGTAPTVSACGTSPTITGHDGAGTVTVGTGTFSTCTITFASAYTTNAPACLAQAAISNVTGGLYISAQSTTAITISATPGNNMVASGKINYQCVGI